MKIGILTYHFARNYGAILQCYALQESLKEMGHDVCVIDYRPEPVARGYAVFDPHRFWGRTPARFFRKSWRELNVIGDRRKRFAAFETFARNRLNLNPSAAGLDLVIVGSDQVWNTALTEGFDPNYWGENGCPARLASYAASLGDLAGVDLQKAHALIGKNFRTPSFREPSSAMAFTDIPGARVDVDPCFLPGRACWEALADSSELRIDEPYLLLYLVKPSAEAVSRAREEALARGLKLITLSAKLEMENSPQVAAASPADFVALVRGASYVVTTSFHGTVFSLLFEKEFAAINASGDRRMSDLLESRDCLGQQRSESLSYLEKITR